jgi:hypothetical protein
MVPAPVAATLIDLSLRIALARRGTNRADSPAWRHIPSGSRCVARTVRARADRYPTRSPVQRSDRSAHHSGDDSLVLNSILKSRTQEAVWLLARQARASRRPPFPNLASYRHFALLEPWLSTVISRKPDTPTAPRPIGWSLAVQRALWQTAPCMFRGAGSHQMLRSRARSRSLWNAK